jgi:hypothetical protein
MSAIFNVRKAMTAYRLSERLKESLAPILFENISEIHSKTRVSGKSVSILTQERRCATICASFVELRAGGFALTSPYSLKQKHIEYLVKLWVAAKQGGGTIENKLTHLRTLCEWMGKQNVVSTLDAYVDRDAHGLKRSYVATEDKSWEAHGVNATALIETIAQSEPHVAVQLKIQAAFGLRRKESFEFKVHRAIKDIETLRVEDGTKGGRPRDVPIQLRLSVLEEAARLANDSNGSMVPTEWTIVQWTDRYKQVMKRFGITKSGLGITGHGLRHGFLQEYYKRLTGEDPPIKGGARPPEDVYRLALQRVVEAAGHSKPSKSGAYLSTHAAMARKSAIRVTAEQAAAAVHDAGGNKAHAAKALGVSRQALYRALERASNSPRQPV